MSKFKVGDRVRITQADYPGHGAVGVVAEVHGTVYTVIRSWDTGMESVSVHEQDLRPADIVPQENDAVNHPSHYTSYKGIEVIQLTEQMNFNRGNAVKYLARAGLKNPATEIEDLKKAAWYLQREIERLEANNE